MESLARLGFGCQWVRHPELRRGATWAHGTSRALSFQGIWGGGGGGGFSKYSFKGLGFRVEGFAARK